MEQIFDLEQAVLLLELDLPFKQRDVQMQRRKLAKRWHPDIAPPGKQFEHERHLKAINKAADQLERLAEESRGRIVSNAAVKASAAAARKARAEAGRRAWEAQQRARAASAEKQKNDPFADRVPDISSVHRYARCLSYPEWGVGTVSGVYFSGSGDDVRQWARVKFQIGIRTVPAGSLYFVDFSKPDPAAERVERFLTAAQRAIAEGNFEIAAQRLIYARDAQPKNIVILRLMTLAFWQSGQLEAAARAARDWVRVDRSRPAAHRFASRIYEQMGAVSLAVESAEREAACAPKDASAWERVGRLRLRQMDRRAAREALQRAYKLGPSIEGLLDLALVNHLEGNTGAEVSLCEAATQLSSGSFECWSRYAHALARTSRIKECIHSCKRALAIQKDAEVQQLLSQMLALEPRELSAAAA